MFWISGFFDAGFASGTAHQGPVFCSAAHKISVHTCKQGAGGIAEEDDGRGITKRGRKPKPACSFGQSGAAALT